jgi:thioredoxin 1
MKNIVTTLAIAFLGLHSVNAQEYITDDTMESTVMVEDGELKILYFTATWCGPCKMMAPVMKELDQDENIDLTVYKMDIDDNITNNILGVSSIPTYFFMKNGVQVGREMSVKKKSEMYELVEKYDAVKPEGEKLAYKPAESNVKFVEGNHAALSKDKIKKLWYNAALLNNFANTAYNALIDKQDLKSAISLTERSLELERLPTTLITQSLIYLKMQELDKARSSAKEAKKMLAAEGKTTGIADKVLLKIEETTKS